VASGSRSPASKDKKIRTQVSVAPNHQNVDVDLPVDGASFAERFQVGALTENTKVERAGKPRSFIRPRRSCP
jgi:hypothetical protein